MKGRPPGSRFTGVRGSPDAQSLSAALCSLSCHLCCRRQVPEDHAAGGSLLLQLGVTERRIVSLPSRGAFCSQISNSPFFFCDLCVFFTGHLIVPFEVPTFPSLSPKVDENNTTETLPHKPALCFFVYWLPSSSQEQHNAEDEVPFVL